MLHRVHALLPRVHGVTVATTHFGTVLLSILAVYAPCLPLLLFYTVYCFIPLAPFLYFIFIILFFNKSGVTLKAVNGKSGKKR